MDSTLTKFFSPFWDTNLLFKVAELSLPSGWSKHAYGEETHARASCSSTPLHSLSHQHPYQQDLFDCTRKNCVLLHQRKAAEQHSREQKEEDRNKADGITFTQNLSDTTTGRGEEETEVLSFVQLIWGTQLSCHLLLTKVTPYLNAHQGISMSLFKHLHLLTHFAVFKTGPFLTALTSHREEENRSQIVLLLYRRHYFSTRTVTISSRVGRRFGRRGNVFLPQLSGPLGGRAFEFELLNVVPAYSGHFWFRFRLQGT